MSSLRRASSPWNSATPRWRDITAKVPWLAAADAATRGDRHRHGHFIRATPCAHEEVRAHEAWPRRVLWCLPKVAHPTASYRAGAREQRTARRRGLGRAAHTSRRTTSRDARRRRATHAADARPRAARHTRLGGAAEGARGARLRRRATQAEPPAAGEPHEHTASGESLGSGEGEGLEQRLQSVHTPTQRQRRAGHRRQR